MMKTILGIERVDEFKDVAPTYDNGGVVGRLLDFFKRDEPVQERVRGTRPASAGR